MRWKGPRRVTCAVFMPEGNGVAVGLEEGEVVLLDARCKPSARWKAHRWEVRALAFAAADRLVSSAQDELHLWDLPKRKLLVKQKLSAMSLELRGRSLYSTGPLALWTLG